MVRGQPSPFGVLGRRLISRHGLSPIDGGLIRYVFREPLMNSMVAARASDCQSWRGKGGGPPGIKLVTFGQGGVGEEEEGCILK